MCETNESIDVNNYLRDNNIEDDEDTMRMRSTIQMEMEDNNINSTLRHKRTREEDSLEEWTVVKNKYSRLNKNNTINDRHVNTTLSYYEITVLCKDKMPKQFSLAKIFKQYNITGISKVKYINLYKVILSFESETQAEKFLLCDIINDLGWKCHRTAEVDISYGIVKGIDVETTIEEFLENVESDVKIITAMRLNKRQRVESNSNTEIKDTWVPSEMIRISFEGASLPNYVYIYDLRVKVESFIFAVTQCSRCWKFGHSRKLCTAKNIVCPKCTENHENCNIDTFKCANCSKNHLSIDKSCPKYQREKKLRELMAEFNCTYRKACLLYIPTPTAREVNDQIVNFNEVITSQTNKDNTENNSNIIVENTTPSFAEITKINKQKQNNKTNKVKNPKSKSKNKRSKNKNNHRPHTGDGNTFWDSDFTHTSDSTVNNESEKEESRRSTHEKNNFDYLQSFIKLKNIICGQESIVEKIKKVVSILTQWFINVVLKNVMELPFSELINNGS